MPDDRAAVNDSQSILGSPFTIRREKTQPKVDDKRACVREYALSCRAVGSVVGSARQPHLEGKSASYDRGHGGTLETHDQVVRNVDEAQGSGHECEIENPCDSGVAAERCHLRLLGYRKQIGRPGSSGQITCEMGISGRLSICPLTPAPRGSKIKH